MRTVIAITLLCFALLACGVPPASNIEPAQADAALADGGAFEQYWTTAERLDRRTCPTRSCGVVGQLMFRESAHVYEIAEGWARITSPYDGSCVSGRSEYVDRGTSDCSEANGFVDGKFAEWVELSGLSTERPADPAQSAAADETLVAQSDDFARHRRAFATAAAQLINDGRCTRADFEEIGGWMKSVNQYRDQPVYFTYCGGMTNANKIYLDASTGRIFR